jgi:hypothetical protein
MTAQIKLRGKGGKWRKPFPRKLKRTGNGGTPPTQRQPGEEG